MRRMISSVANTSRRRAGVSSSWTILNGAPMFSLSVPVGLTTPMTPFSRARAGDDRTALRSYP